jgi:acetyl-CoA carboxylase biotin carboxyl carrier protein
VIEEGDLKVSVRKTVESEPPSGGETPASGPDKAAHPPDSGSNGYHLVRSPMVATFYRAPSPVADVFVEVGDSVKAGQTLCILEAMKLMNELGSDADGVVREVLVDDGAAVEYGQELFAIETT